MKLLPEEPTQEMIEEGAQRLVRVETGNEVWPDSWSPADVAAARNEAERCYRSMYAAAPEVKDEPVGYIEKDPDRGVMHGSLYTWMPLKDGGYLFTHPSPRIAELEAEVARLREQLATARRDALEEAAETCLKLLDSETRDDPRYHDTVECAHAIRALKEKP